MPKHGRVQPHGASPERGWLPSVFAQARRLAIAEGRLVRGTAIARATICLMVVVAINALIGGTGGLPSFYSNLLYLVLLYAGLSLPLPAALLIALVASTGPWPGGLLMVDSFGEKEELLRPLVMAATTMVAYFLSRAINQGLVDRETEVFSFLESMPVGVMALDNQGRPVFSNTKAEELLGRGIARNATPDELATAYGAYVEGTDDRYPAEGMPIVRALSGETTYIDNMEIRRPDGSALLEVFGAPIRDAAGNIKHTVAAFVDITRRRRMEAELVASRERFQAIVESLSDIVSVSDAGGSFLYLSPSIEITLGYTPAELVGRLASEIIIGADFKALRETIADAFKTGIGRGSELRFRHKDGSIRLLQSVGRSGKWEGKTAYIVTSRDVTQQRELQDAVLHMALHDPLTGLPNRRLLYERLDRDLAMARRKGLPASLLSLDLDGFKRINDDHGHAVGDVLLQEVGRRLLSTLREADTVARVGGDEFVIALPETALVEAKQVAERLVAAVEKPVTIAGVQLTPRISYGIAVYDASASVDEVMSAADDAMYRSKSSRRATGQPTR